MRLSVIQYGGFSRSYLGSPPPYQLILLGTLGHDALSLKRLQLVPGLVHLLLQDDDGALDIGIDEVDLAKGAFGQETIFEELDRELRIREVRPCGDFQALLRCVGDFVAFAGLLGYDLFYGVESCSWGFFFFRGQGDG